LAWQLEPKTMSNQDNEDEISRKDEPRERDRMRSAGGTDMRENYLARMMRWLLARGRSWGSHPSRQLRLRETLALGERRFIAVVEFERQKFLIAGTGSSVAMLAALPGEGGQEQRQPGATPEVRDKNEEQKRVAHEDPTWEFSSTGSNRQLIRR
jgi:flagellar biogenesis protein FliO